MTLVYGEVRGGIPENYDDVLDCNRSHGAYFLLYVVIHNFFIIIIKITVCIVQFPVGENSTNYEKTDSVMSRYVLKNIYWQFINNPRNFIPKLPWIAIKLMVTPCKY